MVTSGYDQTNTLWVGIEGESLRQIIYVKAFLFDSPEDAGAVFDLIQEIEQFFGQMLLDFFLIPANAGHVVANQRRV
tara:strand:+ start:67 stop:297 length:231 start_codon:yes stop_codon:yes gene_type:complete